MELAKTTARLDGKHLSLGTWCHLYYRFDGNFCDIPYVQYAIDSQNLENNKWKTNPPRERQDPQSHTNTSGPFY